MAHSPENKSPETVFSAADVQKAVRASMLATFEAMVDAIAEETTRRIIAGGGKVALGGPRAPKTSTKKGKVVLDRATILGKLDTKTARKTKEPFVHLGTKRIISGASTKMRQTKVFYVDGMLRVCLDKGKVDKFSSILGSLNLASENVVGHEAPPSTPPQNTLREKSPLEDVVVVLQNPHVVDQPVDQPDQPDQPNDQPDQPNDQPNQPNDQPNQPNQPDDLADDLPGVLADLPRRIRFDSSFQTAAVATQPRASAQFEPPPDPRSPRPASPRPASPRPASPPDPQLEPVKPLPALEPAASPAPETDLIDDLRREVTVHFEPASTKTPELVPAVASSDHKSATKAVFKAFRKAYRAQKNREGTVEMPRLAQAMDIEEGLAQHMLDNSDALMKKFHIKRVRRRQNKSTTGN